MAMALRLLGTSSLLIAALSLSGCGGGGGGGGGGGPDIPDLVSAVFVGAGAAPAAGDPLLLAFSADLTLVAGTLLNDADVVMSTAGATLGNVSSAPTLLNSRTLQIRLGNGVTFAPGTTTLALRNTNDAVGDSAARLITSSTPSVITAGDAAAPVLSNLTFNEIQNPLSGRGSAAGTLQVPRNGFTIDLSFSDTSGIDHARTSVWFDRPVAVNNASKTPGTNLVPFLTTNSTTATSASYSVPSTVRFTDGITVATAMVFDVTGRVSSPVSFQFTVRALTDDVRPFETSVNAQQIWYLDLSRDVESYTHTNSPTQPLTVNPGASGRSDLEDLMVILGLLGNDTNVNNTVMGGFKANLLIQLGLLYSGTNVSFTFTAPGTFPSNQVQVPYRNLSFSQIAIAGSESVTGTSNVLGLALLDLNNQFQDNNAVTNLNGNQRLGVFLHTLLNTSLRPPGSSVFRLTYDQFTPFFNGTPIGNDIQDAQRFTGLNDARTTAINNAIARLARFTAVVTAHECGHSVGLVADGPQPTGLYGGDPTNFPGSTDGHILNADLFPSGSQNVMSPSINFDPAISPATAFNRLNMAYLRERVIYAQ